MKDLFFPISKKVMFRNNRFVTAENIKHRSIRNELTVRYAQNYNPLKVPTYPKHPDYYSLVIKFKVLGLSKF